MFAPTQKNPYFLTCGDQYTYQTPENLKNYWRHFGYEADIITDDAFFPRSILGAPRRKTDVDGTHYEPDNSLNESVKYLSEAAVKLNKAASNYIRLQKKGRIVVLGCTNNAAWVHNLAGDHISCFADENPNRICRQFYKKNVIHPSSLTADDLLIIPYAATSDMLEKKFSGLYKAKIVKI